MDELLYLARLRDTVGWSAGARYYRRLIDVARQVNAVLRVALL